MLKNLKNSKEKTKNVFQTAKLAAVTFLIALASYACNKDNGIILEPVDPIVTVDTMYIQGEDVPFGSQIWNLNKQTYTSKQAGDTLTEHKANFPEDPLFAYNGTISFDGLAGDALKADLAILNDEQLVTGTTLGLSLTDLVNTADVYDAIMIGFQFDGALNIGTFDWETGLDLIPHHLMVLNDACSFVYNGPVATDDMLFFCDAFSDEWILDVSEFDLALPDGETSFALEEFPSNVKNQNLSAIPYTTGMDYSKHAAVQNEELDKILAHKEICPNALYFDVAGNQITDFTPTYIITSEVAGTSNLSEAQVDAFIAEAMQADTYNGKYMFEGLTFDVTNQAFLNKITSDSGFAPTEYGTNTLDFEMTIASTLDFNLSPNFDYDGNIDVTTLLSSKEEQAFLTNNVSVGVTDPATAQMLFNAEITEEGDILYYKTTYFGNQPYTIVKPIEAARFTSLNAGDLTANVNYNEAGVHFTGGECNTDYDPDASFPARMGFLTNLKNNVDPRLSDETYRDKYGNDMTSLVLENTK